MKFVLSLLLVASMLPIKGHAQSLSKAELDAIMNGETENVCKDVTKAKAELKTKVKELAKLRTELKAVTDNNNLFHATKTVKKIGLGSVALGATLITLVGVRNKIKYGQAAFEFEGIVTQIAGGLMVQLGAVAAAAGAAGQYMSRSDIDHVQAKLDVVIAETSKLYNSLKSCT